MVQQDAGNVGASVLACAIFGITSGHVPSPHERDARAYI